jgi:hypothetical protein
MAATFRRAAPKHSCHNPASNDLPCMHLQDSELPVWRQLQQHCASTPAGKGALQRDEARQRL